MEYTNTAKNQLRKLDKQAARRILDCIDERVVARTDFRIVAKTLAEASAPASASTL